MVEEEGTEEAEDVVEMELLLPDLPLDKIHKVKKRTCEWHLGRIENPPLCHLHLSEFHQSLPTALHRGTEV